jgi:AMP-polyphosphate phosphotransferase
MLPMTINLSDFEAGTKFGHGYQDALAKLQKRLAELQSLHIIHNCRTIIVFEGWDASGKGGIIKRMTADWDPRFFAVHPIAAPTAEEKDKHFLWRFWNKLPGSRDIAVFDRSHYGRVLVERVEGFCSEADWKRGYDEINEFESQQVDIGTKIIKIFLHITQESQDKVLADRIKEPAKRWKVTEDDFRNRARRADYLTALGVMFELTNTRWAPWKAFDANNQKAARIAVLHHIVAELEAFVPQDFPEIDAGVAALAKKAFG